MDFKNKNEFFLTTRIVPTNTNTEVIIVTRQKRISTKARCHDFKYYYISMHCDSCHACNQFPLNL